MPSEKALYLHSRCASHDFSSSHFRALSCLECSDIYNEHQHTSVLLCLQQQDSLGTCHNHRIMEWLGLEGTLETILSNPCAKAETDSRGLHQGGFECLQGSRLHSPLGSLFQCSVILATQNFSLIFRWNSLCFVCNRCSMLLSLEKVWPHYLYTVSPKTFVALIQYI